MSQSALKSLGLSSSELASALSNEWQTKSQTPLCEDNLDDFLDLAMAWISSKSENQRENQSEREPAAAMSHTTTIAGSCKSEEAAGKCRDRGNEEFKRKEFLKALEFYTQVSFEVHDALPS